MFIHTLDGMRFRHEKEGNPAICNYMDGPGGQKSDGGRQIPSLSLACGTETSSQIQRTGWGLSEAAGEGDRNG